MKPCPKCGEEMKLEYTLSDRTLFKIPLTQYVIILRNLGRKLRVEYLCWDCDKDKIAAIF